MLMLKHDILIETPLAPDLLSKKECINVIQNCKAMKYDKSFMFF